MPILVLDFITNSLGLVLAHRALASAYFVVARRGRTPLLAPLQHGGRTIPDARSISLHSESQATDSVSRSRDEITVETPSPRMLIPYRASAISIVRFW
jgi:hypothetical protein